MTTDEKIFKTFEELQAGQKILRAEGSPGRYPAMYGRILSL